MICIYLHNNIENKIVFLFNNCISYLRKNHPFKQRNVFIENNWTVRPNIPNFYLCILHLEISVNQKI